MNVEPANPAPLKIQAVGSSPQEMQAAVAEVAPLLRAGRLVAFPTETVYGLGANALDADAVARIFVAKQRPSTHPLIVHIANIDDLPKITSQQTELARKLASQGMSERHYAPNARLLEVARNANGSLLLPAPPAGPWALIAFATGQDADADPPATVAVAMPHDPAGYARKLFATLHEVEAAKCQLVCIEALPDGQAWEAVADRLRRAGLRRANAES